MKALVTGATGFLGRHLTPALEAAGWEVVALNSRNCDLRVRDRLLSYAEWEFDRIYHLAAWTKAGDFCLHHKGEQWLINQAINTNVLWYWHTFQPQALMVAMGTSCAYPPELELTEENYLVAEPDRDLFTYAMTKRMLYVGLRALHHQYGLRFCHLVPSTLFGPGFDAADSHFIFDLIKKIVAGKGTGDGVALWGTGAQVRELVYVKDAVRLVELAVNRVSDDSLNISSGVGYSIREYAQMICRIVGYDPAEIIYDPTKFSGVAKKVLSSERRTRMFDFSFTPVEKALAETIAYWQTAANFPGS